MPNPGGQIAPRTWRFPLKYFATFLSFALISCIGADGPSYLLFDELRTYHKGDVWVDPAHAENQLLMVSTAFAYHFDFDPAQVQAIWGYGRIRLSFHEKALACSIDGVTSVCGGYTKMDITGYWMNVYYKPCIGDTALAHEALHVLMDYYFSDPDPNHESEWVWISASGFNTVEYYANARARREICGFTD